MKPDLLAYYVLEWSPSQEAFHHATVQEMLTANWDTYLHHANSASDWVVVGIAQTLLELETWKQRLVAQLDTPNSAFPDIPPEEHL